MNWNQFKETTKEIFFFIVMLICNLNSLGQDGAPAVFAPGVISSKESSEYGMTFINDSFILFTRQTHLPEIYSSRKINNSWTDLQRVSFSSSYGDEYPHYSKNLHRIYFASKRPLPGTDTPRVRNDIWYVTLNEDNSFGQSMHLGGLLSTSGIESGPALSNDGILYFHSNRSKTPGLNGVDLYSCKIKRQKVKQVTKLSVSTDVVDGEAYIDPQQRFMIFMSAGHGAIGGGDLFISYLKRHKWSKPESLGTLINTTDWEGTPTMSVSQELLYFSRNNDGVSDIFYIPVRSLPAIHSVTGSAKKDKGI